MREYYIGHSADKSVRYKASSGGIATSIIKYCLEHYQYGTSITYEYDINDYKYKPKLIHSYENYTPTGSIYHDIDIFSFIRENIDNITNGIVLTCTPCLVKAIRSLLNKHQIPSLILSFSCSGQMDIKGTWKYLDFLGIEKHTVSHLQYRGNGWPSGIQIILKDGRSIFKENYSEPWITIHSSKLYQPKRCRYCKFESSYDSDITLADPWLEDYVNNDTEGNTLFFYNTSKGEEIIRTLVSERVIETTNSSYEEYAISQRPNIHKVINHIKNRRYYQLLYSTIDIPIYYKIVSHSLFTMSMHNKLFSLINRIFNIKNSYNKIREIISKLTIRCRSHFIKAKLKKCGNNVNFYKNITINHPECISFADNIGVGENTFFGPVIEYAGVPYSPKISIGEGTWIGKNCSIAAIDSVLIGKNVLFAGYVHITDHSHGYEDISLPISENRLISKGPVSIGDCCWLGFNCEILSGVSIGEHSVIAARAVVTKDVPPYSIAAGNPARIVKKYDINTKTWIKVN